MSKPIETEGKFNQLRSSFKNPLAELQAATKQVNLKLAALKRLSGTNSDKPLPELYEAAVKPRGPI